MKNEKLQSFNQLINHVNNLKNEKKAMQIEINDLKNLNDKIVFDNSISFPFELSILQDNQNIRIINKIGISLSGQAFLIENLNTKEKYFYKISHKMLTDKDTINAYVDSLLSVQNPAIFNFSSITPKQIFNDNHLIITKKFVQDKSLYQLLNLQNSTFFSNTIKFICLLGIALGMQYLHSLNIVHGNLKPENVFLDDKFYPHICDFGLTKFIKSNIIDKSSLIFMAPEVIKKLEVFYKSALRIICKTGQHLMK